MRQANIELLRLISIILIVILHADFFSLGAPDFARLTQNSFVSISQIAIEALAICSVNVFVLISGWFGIKPSKKSLCNLCFQILYFTIGIFLFTNIAGLTTFNIGGVLSIFFLTNNGWFIRSYILLMILAPILNKYIDSAQQSEFKCIIIFFFVFQTIYGWLFGVAKFFDYGYSTISFIGIYLLARYIKIYTPRFSAYNKLYDFSIFLFLTILLMIITIITIYINKSRIDQLYAYNNPVVLVMSIYLFLFFTKLKINSSIIISLASSSFAIYLLHCNPNIMDSYFVAPIKHFYQNYSGVESLLYITSIVLIYIIGAIVIDIPRKYIWNKYLLPKLK